MTAAVEGLPHQSGAVLWCDKVGQYRYALPSRSRASQPLVCRSSMVDMTVA